MSDFLSEKKNLNNAMKDIEKRFGKGSVMLMTSETDKTLEFVSSGSITIDKALGGGFPKGRIIEIYGPESSGKTTLALESMSEVQKAGGVVAFVDVEHALDPTYAKNIGVKMEELIFSQPDTGEQALEIVEALVRTGEVSMVVLDSVAALVPEAEINGDMGASHVGLHARLMSQAMRKLSGIVSKTNTIVLFINQIREKVGIMFGNPETTTGGRALKFYASQRLEIRKGEVVKNGNEMIGGQMRVKVVKNKVAPPYKEAKVNVVFGKGIDADAEVVELGVDLDIINKAGSWLSYDNLKSQGTENFKLLLLENPEILNEIREKIKEAL